MRATGGCRHQAKLSLALVGFKRYSDDAVRNWATEQQARKVLAALEERMAGVGLQLHPGKNQDRGPGGTRRRPAWAGRPRRPPAARRVAEDYPCESVTELDDGRLRIGLRTPDTAWVRRLALRLGEDARVISPPELADETRAGAAAALALYE